MYRQTGFCRLLVFFGLCRINNLSVFNASWPFDSVPGHHFLFIPVASLQTAERRFLPSMRAAPVAARLGAWSASSRRVKQLRGASAVECGARMGGRRRGLIEQRFRADYGAKYPEISRTSCTGFDANELIKPFVVGTIAMLEVTAPSGAFSVETRG